MRLTKHPSGIPVAVRRDALLIKWVTVWRNKCERYHYLSKRTNPYHPNRAQREKANTIERKAVAAEIRAFERDIMRWLAEHARHPDIYTPTVQEAPLQNLTTPLEPFSPTDTPRIRRRKERAQKHRIQHLQQQIKIESSRRHESVYANLVRQWHAARRQAPGFSTGLAVRRQITQANTKTRHRVAVKIQDLEWKWLSALHARIFPNQPLPHRYHVTPSRFKP